MLKGKKKKKPTNKNTLPRSYHIQNCMRDRDSEEKQKLKAKMGRGTEWTFLQMRHTNGQGTWKDVQHH